MHIIWLCRKTEYENSITLKSGTKVIFTYLSMGYVYFVKGVVIIYGKGGRLKWFGVIQNRPSSNRFHYKSVNINIYFSAY